MRLRILLFIFSAAFLLTAEAQIKGKVFNIYDNTPLQGATITFAGKGSVTTDRDGNFTADCSKTGEITISFVGFETFRSVIRKCGDVVNIGLSPTTNKLDEVEITATSNENKSILYQPVSITRLKETEIKRGTGLFLDDAINANVPGVSMQRRAVSSGQQFNIRGYGNGSRGTRGISSNFDGQGYKVYLNGIAITDAEGITVLDDIDYASIGNVEVTKGPAGTLYGLAIAGVVNLKTIKPQPGKVSIGQDVLIGGYGLERYTTSFQMGKEHSSLLVNYGHQKSDGFMSHSRSHKDFVNIAGEFQPSEKQNFSYFLGYSNSYDERAGELTVAQYDSMNYIGNPNYIKNNAHSNVISIRAGLSHTYTFSKSISNTTTVFGSGLTNNASSAGGWTDKTPINYGVRSTLDTRFSLGANTSLSGITGVEMQRQNAQTIGYSMGVNPQDPLGYNIITATTSNIYTVSKTTSLFTEWTLALPHDISVTGGVGVSNMYIQLNDRIYAVNKPTFFEKKYNDMVSPHVALNKVFSKRFSLYASYSKAYKAPVSSYFYIPYVATTPGTTGQVNTNLKAEIGDQFEVGTKGTLLGNKLTYEVALFHAEFSNKFTTVAVPYNNTTTLYSYMVNGGSQDHKGIEALVKWTAYQSVDGFFEIIRPFGNLAYSDFKYKNFVFETGTTTANLTKTDYSNLPVAGVPKFTGNLGVDVEMKHGLYANALYSYRDGVPVTSTGTIKSTSFSLLNAKIGFRRSISSHFDLNAYVGCDNITNTQYPLMIFVNQIPDAYLPAPLDAVYYGGLSIKYNF